MLQGLGLEDVRVKEVRGLEFGWRVIPFRVQIPPSKNQKKNFYSPDASTTEDHVMEPCSRKFGFRRRDRLRFMGNHRPLSLWRVFP